MAFMTQLKSPPNTRFLFAYEDNTDPLGKGFIEKDHLVHKYSQRLCVFHQLMFLRARMYLPFFSAKIFLIVTLSFGLNRTITPLL